MCGLQGIRTYHSLDNKFFPMRFYCPLSFGNLKAMIKLKGTVSVGTLKPCHQCNVAAVRDTWSTSPISNMYYIPLMVPGTKEDCLESKFSTTCTPTVSLKRHTTDLIWWEARQNESASRERAVSDSRASCRCCHTLIWRNQYCTVLSMQYTSTSSEP